MAIDRSKGSAHWWLGPNSLFGVAINQTAHGKDSIGDQYDKYEHPLSNWFKNLFKGTGVTVTAGVSPDEKFSKEMKIGVLLLLVVWMGSR